VIENLSEVIWLEIVFKLYIYL